MSLPIPGAPAAPTDVTFGPSDDGIRVDFTAPAPGDGAITKYQYSTDDGATWADVTPTGTGSLEVDLTWRATADSRSRAATRTGSGCGP